MMLKSFGCSLIFGNELHDDNRNHSFPSASRHTWPALLARHADLEYTCYARGGSGNLAIFDQVLRHISAGGHDFYIIGWTWSSRFDYNQATLRDQHSWSTLAPAQQQPRDDFYYRELHSEYRDVLTTLTYMMTTAKLLKERDLPFLMTMIDPTVFDPKFRVLPGMCLLQNQVRADVTDFEGQDFLSWSRHKGFEITEAEHPLEPAHAAAAELLQIKFDTILRRA